MPQMGNITEYETSSNKTIETNRAAVCREPIRKRLLGAVTLQNSCLMAFLSLCFRDWSTD